MSIVDTHCHAGLNKYEPVESLLHHMETNGVAQAVLIQYGGNTDNSYLVDCLERYPGKLAAAMIVAEDDDGRAVRDWAARGIQGIRLRANARATASDPLAQWRAAAETGLVVSAPCQPAWLLSTQFLEVIDTFPDLHIVIEHLAGVGTDAVAPYDEFREALQRVASRPNLSMKVPGFGEFCPLPMPFEPIPPLALMALETLGVERLMWGSDYPPVSSREGYGNSLRVPMEHFSHVSESDCNAIFGGTAQAVWGLPSV
jgi:L-fuconolactonase